MLHCKLGQSYKSHKVTLNAGLKENTMKWVVSEICEKLRFFPKNMLVPCHLISYIRTQKNTKRLDKCTVRFNISKDHVLSL